MTLEILTFTQIAAILVYVASVFFIYKLLGTQKDASIETLKIQIEFLELKLRETEKNTPDVLAEAQSNRIKNLNDELARMKADSDTSSASIFAKEKELDKAKLELATMAEQIARAEAVLEKYGCPHCKAPLVFRDEDFKIKIDAQGNQTLIDSEEVLYACGLRLKDDTLISECSNTPAESI